MFKWKLGVLLVLFIYTIHKVIVCKLAKFLNEFASLTAPVCVIFVPLEDFLRIISTQRRVKKYEDDRGRSTEGLWVGLMDKCKNLAAETAKAWVWLWELEFFGVGGVTDILYYGRKKNKN